MVAKKEIQGLEASLKMLRKHQNVLTTSTNANIAAPEVEAQKLIELQKQEIRKLRSQIIDLETKITDRPLSGSRLPPLHQLFI